MTDKVNGFVGRAWAGNVDNSAESLVGSLDIFTFSTTLDITPTGVATYTAGTQATNYVDTRVQDSQWLFDKIIETISTRGQPVVLTNVVSASSSTSGIPAAGSTATTVYSFTFMIERSGSWYNVSNDGTVDLSLLNTALNGVGYGSNVLASGSDANFVVTLANNFKNTSTAVII